MSSNIIKVRVRDFKEIEETFSRERCDKRGAYFSPGMDKFCGKEIHVKIDVDHQYDYVYTDEREIWFFTKEWLDIPAELSEQDHFTVLEIDEMLSYFLSNK